MAIYTTFFLCRPEELLGGFSGWRLPLETPVRRRFRNPLTGQESVIETHEPVWPEDVANEAEREYQAVEITGDYADYLEGRLPPFVASCMHWAAKGLTEVELAPLIKVTGVTGAIECAVYSPPSLGAIIQQMPAEFLVKLGSLDQRAVAEQWAAALSTPEHTHSVSGVQVADAWTTGEALEVLHPLVTLAQKATPAQQLYLLIEC